MNRVFTLSKVQQITVQMFDILTKALDYNLYTGFMSFIHVEELFIDNCDFQKTLLRKYTLETRQYNFYLHL